ncbi:lantibiotic dehydratase C-terminal domain-containing protein [Embleya sp. AB8]|uniref:lantibiotic dehydratase C-terminal domain-containing protein n=1 Tax=Embleya sp. AB8 TaxID=3156304 RepID=UPI003C70951D
MNPTGTPAAPTAPPGAWQSVHVFYAASSRPLIVDCVQPLVEALRAERLIAGYFFINYWVEGPHLRLRLKPASAAVAETVHRRTEEALRTFLRRRPALYEVQHDFSAVAADTLFDLEFTPEERLRYQDADGRMRLRPTNTFSDERYEPEYGKYGGPAGVALAEWHFERSSDLVIAANQTMNLHVRAMLLGLSAQLMMVTTTAFLPDPAAALGFFQSYHDFWSGSLDETDFIRDADYARAYERMGDRVARRYVQVREALTSDTPQALPAVLGAWYEHGLELRRRVAELAVRGELVFESWEGRREQRITDPDQAAGRLLFPYIHMTNNRLYVTLDDEAYLSQVLANALRDADASAVS